MCTDWFLLPSRPKSSGCRSLFLTWVWFSSLLCLFRRLSSACISPCHELYRKSGSFVVQGTLPSNQTVFDGNEFPTVSLSIVSLSSNPSFKILLISWGTIMTKFTHLCDTHRCENCINNLTILEVSLDNDTRKLDLIWFDLIWFEFDVSRSKASIEKWTNGQSETAYISYRKMFEEKEPDGLAVYWLTSGVDPDARLA